MKLHPPEDDTWRRRTTFPPSTLLLFICSDSYIRTLPVLSCRNTTCQSEFILKWLKHQHDVLGHGGVQGHFHWVNSGSCSGQLSEHDAELYYFIKQPFVTMQSDNTGSWLRFMVYVLNSGCQCFTFSLSCWSVLPLTEGVFSPWTLFSWLVSRWISVSPGCLVTLSSTTLFSLLNTPLSSSSCWTCPLPCCNCTMLLYTVSYVIMFCHGVYLHC